MRIGLAIETDAPGGAETMLLQLARELLAKGHDVVAVGPSGGEGWLTARFAELGVERVFIDVHGFRGTPRVVRELGARIRELRLDVLHSHEFAMSVFGALAARMTGCRHVITMHGSSYYTEVPRRLVGLRLAAALSHSTVAVSKALRVSLAESLRISPHAIDLVHNGVASVPADGGGVRAELGLNPADLLVVAVGSLYPVKGHAVLIRAIARMPASTRPAVAIAGGGFEEANLRALKRECGVDGDVRLLGYRADIPDLLQAADIFVMPSLSEGLPMAMIEAMLAACPVVASDAGGIRELISGPEFGLLTEPGDSEALAESLQQLMQDGGRRRQLGEAGRRRALDHFTASAMAERYLELYGAVT